MFFHLLFIHLFRPLLKYNQTTSPLPPNVSPRKLCTQAAGMISKLLRLYKRTYGLRQICNIAVYMAHTACTIHILNLPDKNARRDIIHGVRQLEEIAECWLCARRTLLILAASAERWNIDLPEEAATVLTRIRTKYGPWNGVESHVQVSENSPQSNLQSIAQPLTSSQMPSIPSHGFLNASSTVSPSLTPDNPPRSSSIMSLPPQSASDMSRMSRQSTIALPEEQRKAWNQYQYRRISQPTASTGQQPTSPSMLFGGVDSLVNTDSQEWWMKDQSQFALGFDNWVGMEPEWPIPGSGVNGMAGINGYPQQYMENGSNRNSNIDFTTGQLGNDRNGYTSTHGAAYY